MWSQKERKIVRMRWHKGFGPIVFLYTTLYHQKSVVVEERWPSHLSCQVSFTLQCTRLASLGWPSLAGPEPEAHPAGLMSRPPPRHPSLLTNKCLYYNVSAFLKSCVHWRSSFNHYFYLLPCLDLRLYKVVSIAKVPWVNRAKRKSNFV